MNLIAKYLKILKVIDMQIDFLTGILKNPAAEAIIDAVIAEIEAWDGIIIATRDTHFDDDSYYQSIEGKRLPIHCVYGTPGWEIEPRIMAALKKGKQGRARPYLRRWVQGEAQGSGVPCRAEAVPQSHPEEPLGFILVEGREVPGRNRQEHPGGTGGHKGVPEKLRRNL